MDLYFTAGRSGLIPMCNRSKDLAKSMRIGGTFQEHHVKYLKKLRFNLWFI